jgi:hypothetical protein
MDKRCKNCKQFVVFQDNLPDVGYCKLETPTMKMSLFAGRQVFFKVKEAQMCCNSWAEIAKKPAPKAKKKSVKKKKTS